MKIERSGFISQRHGSADPDPHRYVMDPQHWNFNFHSLIENMPRFAINNFLCTLTLLHGSPVLYFEQNDI
jgi:hypothetical protein